MTCGAMSHEELYQKLGVRFPGEDVDPATGANRRLASAAFKTDDKRKRRNGDVQPEDQ